MLSPEAHACNLRGNTRLAFADYAGAIAEFNRAIALTPLAEAALLFYNRGTARHLQHDLPGALADFDQSLQLDPSSAEAHNNRGMTLQLMGDLHRALPAFEHALALNPNYAQAYNNRGIARRGLGDPAAAAADFSRAIQCAPDYAEAWNNRGVIRQSQGDLAGAIDDFDRALALNPGYAEALGNRASARHDLALRQRPLRPRAFLDHATPEAPRTDLADALADFDRALQLVPRHASVAIRHNRGAARHAQGDLRGALADFDEALAIDPHHAPTYANRGTVRKALGDLAGARADLDRALELMPREAAAAAYHNRGGVRVLQNDFAGAVADYDAALALEPGLLVARLSRGNARYHLREPDAFSDHLAVLQTDLDFSVAEIVRMSQDDLRHDARAALRNCDAHLRLNPSDVTALCRRAIFRYLQGQPAAATQDVAQAIQLAPQIQIYLERLTAEAQRVAIPS